MAARRFAASFVVTVTVSCAPAAPPETPRGDSSTHLERQADGTCLLSEEIECPPDATCNPPPPRRVDCDTREPIADEPRPALEPAGQPPVSESVGVGSAPR
jgi:hypothetical protein